MVNISESDCLFEGISRGGASGSPVESGDRTIWTVPSLGSSEDFSAMLRDGVEV